MCENPTDIFFADTTFLEGWDKIIIVMDDETFDSFEDEALANGMTPGEWYRKLNNERNSCKIRDEQRVKVLPKSIFFRSEDEEDD